MSRILALATNTLREAVRDRVLYSIVFFAVGIIALSLLLDDITVGDQNKVVRSVAQGSIDIFGSVIAIFLGVSLVWKEVERRTVYTIISKPITRWQFILGKYLGMVLTLVVELTILLAVYVAFMTVQQGWPPPVVYWSVFMLLLELMLLASWATLFSAYSTPTTAGAFTLAVFVIGHLADDIWRFGSQAASPAAQEVSRYLYWALPNFEMFNIRNHAVHELPIPWDHMAGATAYGLLYTSLVLVLAMVVFERRDLR